VTTYVAAVLGAIVLALVVTAALGASRLRVLSRRIGSFECAARAAGRQPGEDEGGAWTAGIAHYGAGRIDWWRSWSLAPRPAHTWRRDDLTVVSRSAFVGPGGQEQLVARCRSHDAEFELTMSTDAFAGLTAWLEAAPPSDISRVI
jgi:Protein of unknown function (DUF2550)